MDFGCTAVPPLGSGRNCLSRYGSSAPEVDRRARRVKTDRVDAESLLRALQSWRRGDRQACAFVGAPSIEDEDARRPQRELARLRKERVSHVNRIKALLALYGVRDYRPL